MILPRNLNRNLAVLEYYFLHLYWTRFYEVKRYETIYKNCEYWQTNAIRIFSLSWILLVNLILWLWIKNVIYKLLNKYFVKKTFTWCDPGEILEMLKLSVVWGRRRSSSPLFESAAASWWITATGGHVIPWGRSWGSTTHSLSWSTTRIGHFISSQGIVGIWTRLEVEFSRIHKKQ